METAKAKQGRKLTKQKQGFIRAKTDFFRTARYGLTQQEHRLIYYTILIGQQDGKPFVPVTIPIKQFKEMFELKGQSSYSTIRKLSEKLASKVVEVIYRDDRGSHLMQAAWLSSIVYHAKDGTVTVTPNEAIKPFFEGKPFTNTEFAFLLKFNSQYAERLYELLKSLHFKSIIDFKVFDLRKHLGVGEKQYQNYNMFKTRVLEPAIHDINEFTDLDVTLQDKERGLYNKVETIYFVVSKKDNYVPLAKRIERGDYMPPLSEEEQEQFMQELLGEEKQMIPDTLEDLDNSPCL